jgi:hypothetical protein
VKASESDHRIAGLLLGQMQFAKDNRHQRSEAEPAEEAEEKCEPSHVEGTHGRAVEVQ